MLSDHENHPSLEQLQQLAVVMSSAELGWLKQFVDKGGLDGLGKLLTDLCRFNERSEEDWQRIDTSMRCVKALQRRPEGIKAMVKHRAICKSFVAGGGSLLLCDREPFVSACVKVLCAVAVSSEGESEGHTIVLNCLEELAMANSEEGDARFKLLVEKLREPRNPTQRWVLTLLNAIVNGPADIETRVQMRNELCGLEFIEVYNQLLTSAGDEIDCQIAIFDQEMRADSEELQGEKSTPILMPVAATTRVAALEKQLGSQTLVAQLTAMLGALVMVDGMYARSPSLWFLMGEACSRGIDILAEGKEPSAEDVAERMKASFSKPRTNSMAAQPVSDAVAQKLSDAARRVAEEQASHRSLMLE
jgi:hypothetical protein